MTLDPLGVGHRAFSSVIDMRHDRVHAHGIEHTAGTGLPIPGDEGDEHSGRVNVRPGNPARHRVGGKRHSSRMRLRGMLLDRPSAWKSAWQQQVQSYGMGQLLSSGQTESATPKSTKG